MHSKRLHDCARDNNLCIFSYIFVYNRIMFVFIIKKKKKQKNNCLQHFLMLFCAFWALCVHMIYMIIPNSRSNAITDGMQKDFLWFSSSARETFFFGSKRFHRVLAACRFARVCLTWMARCSFFFRGFPSSEFVPDRISITSRGKKIRKARKPTFWQILHDWLRLLIAMIPSGHALDDPNLAKVRARAATLSVLVSRKVK